MIKTLHNLNRRFEDEINGKNISSVVLKKTVEKIVRETLKINQNLRWYECSLCNFDFSSSFSCGDINDIDIVIDYCGEHTIAEVRIKGVPLAA